MDLHPAADDEHVSGAFLRGGKWESGQWSFLQKHLQQHPGAAVLDLGANIGTFTLQAAAAGHHVVAVEAFQRNIQKLCSSILRNGLQDRVVLYKAAVWGDVQGTLALEAPAKNLGGTGVQMGGAGAGVVFVGREEVPKMLVDDLMPDLAGGAYVMKIDIEGSECRALESASFWAHPPVAASMEWGNLKSNRALCPQAAYDALVGNIQRYFGQNLRNYKLWDARLVLKPGLG